MAISKQPFTTLVVFEYPHIFRQTLRPRIRIAGPAEPLKGVPPSLWLSVNLVNVTRVHLYRAACRVIIKSSCRIVPAYIPTVNDKAQIRSQKLTTPFINRSFVLFNLAWPWKTCKRLCACHLRH